MARKIVNRKELKAAAEAALAKSTPSTRKASAELPPVDPTFRVLKLDDGLLNTYFSWCPVARMPAVAPNCTDPMACGQLHLRMQRLAGLRHLWDLVGKSGWLIIEGLWLDSEPCEQYLLFSAHIARGTAPGKAVVPIHLWQLWQPSYKPRFVWRPNGMPEPSEAMRAALESTLKQHLTASTKDWVDRVHAASRTNVESRIEALNRRIAELDEHRRLNRKTTRTGDEQVKAMRHQLLEAEQQVADLSASLSSLQRPTPPVVRQRLCEVQWFVQAPEPHPDPLYARLEGPSR